MDFRLRLPGAVYRQARDKAGDEASLAALLVAYLTAYAEGRTAQQRGGVASAARLTPEKRSARGRQAVAVRWDRVRAAQAED